MQAPARAAVGVAQGGGGVDIERGHPVGIEGVADRAAAPHSNLRAAVTPARRGMGAPQSLPPADVAKPPTPRHVAMSWARRLRRVFGIEIEACVGCGGKLQVIASIEELQTIVKILAHVEKTAPNQSQSELPLGARNTQ